MTGRRGRRVSGLAGSGEDLRLAGHGVIGRESTDVSFAQQIAAFAAYFAFKRQHFQAKGGLPPPPVLLRAARLRKILAGCPMPILTLTTIMMGIILMMI